MSLLLFANNASTTLAAAITSAATSVSVASGQGALFPVPSGGQYFRATFVKNGSPGTFEIVKVTAASADTFTIVRAQEGTTALAWAIGDYFNLFVTSADLAAFAQFDDLQSQGGGYAVDTGVANASVVALTPALTQHIVGMPIRWKAAQSNTGACTFSDGVGALQNITPEFSPLVQGDIVAGGVYVTVYDGTFFQTVTLHRTHFSQLAGQATAAQVPALSALNGSVTAGQVPEGAVTQYEADLAISHSQVSGLAASATTDTTNASNITSGTLAVGRVGGLAASATTDTTNASNISSGTLALARLPQNIVVSGVLAAGGSFASADGDISADRGNGTGIVFLGNSNTYVYFSGAAYIMPTYTVQAGGFQVTSDERLKEGMAALDPTDSLKVICQIPTHSFVLKNTGKRTDGITAQNVQAVLPHAVALLESEDGNPEGHLAVDLMPLVAHLIGAVQALQDRVAALEAR